MEPQNLITPTDPITTIEPNDIILLANEIKLDSSSPVEIPGQIGDRPDILANNDVDLFEVELNAGDTLLADINAEINGSSLNSVLTIFDINGNLLVQNDDNSFVDGGIELFGITLGGETVTEPDPFQQFTAIEDGTYYVGVSSSGNLDFNPTIADSGTGDSSGTYSLVLTIEELSADELAAETNDRISLANLIELDSSSPAEILGQIGDRPDLLANNDVDLFEVELEERDILLADINAETIGSDLDAVLDAVLSVFDINSDSFIGAGLTDILDTVIATDSESI